MSKCYVGMKVNGKSVSAEVEPRTLLIHYLRENLGLTGPHIGCDTSHCGACTVDLDGKSVKSCTIFAVQAEGAEVLTIEGMAGRRRQAARLAGGLSRNAWPAMRLLHARHDHARPSPAAGKRRTPAKPRSAWAYPAISAAAPATRTSSKPSNTPPRRSMASNIRKPRNERSHRSHFARARRKTARHGLQAQARRGRALHPGPRQLYRRHQAARHAARRLSSLQSRPCAHPQDRHVEGQGRPRRRRGADRRGSEGRQPRLDADARRRRADGAGRRQGAFPEPGNRLRRRHRPLYRRRRGRPGGSGV